MKIVKVSTPFPQWPLCQQTPGGTGVWGDYRFLVNQPTEECDYWVVYEGLTSKESIRCVPGGAVLLTAEPPNIKRYSADFLSQFSLVFSAHQSLKSRVVQPAPPCLPWHVGRHSDGGADSFDKNYDFLSSCMPPEKQRLISVITSDKTFTSEHRYRLEFVRALERALGADLHVYGRGIKEIDDKWDAIAPYKYHVVVENGSFLNYWTEKLSDAYLAWAFPLYMGCPNVESFFSPRALVKLDWGQTAAAIRKIEAVLGEDPFTESLAFIGRARRQCLDEYNFFPYVARICARLPSSAKRARVTLRPEAADEYYAARFRRVLHRLTALVGRPGP
jgi:hypothetical protein